MNKSQVRREESEREGNNERKIIPRRVNEEGEIREENKER